MQRILRALTIAAVAIGSTTVAGAQRVDRVSGGGEASPAVPAAPQEASQSGWLHTSHQDTGLVGSWLDTVTVAGGPTFKSLSTYTADGSWITHDQGTVITEPPFPHVFSAGHGVWERRGSRTFSQTALQLISDLKGNLVYLNKIRQSVTLSRSGDSYRAVWRAEFTDPAGNLAVSFEGTTEGRRIKVEIP